MFHSIAASPNLFAILTRTQVLFDPISRDLIGTEEVAAAAGVSTAYVRSTARWAHFPAPDHLIPHSNGPRRLWTSDRLGELVDAIKHGPNCDQ